MKDLVQKYYLGYFGRPADEEGLDFYVGKVEAANESRYAVTDVFSNDSEYTNSVPKNADGGVNFGGLVDLIYQNLFGRAADTAGKAWYVERLEDGTFTVQDIVIRIVDGVQANDPDETAMANRVEVANYLTENFAGIAIPAEIQLLLDDVTADAATKASAVAAIDAWLAETDPVVPPVPPVDGQTFWLTEGADRGADFVGTQKSDLFIGDVLQNMLGQQVNSLGTGDRLDGAGGWNKLEAQVTEGAYAGGGNMPIQARTQNIQEVKLEAMNANMNAANSDVYVNAKNMYGIEEIWSWNSNGNLVVKDLTTMRSDGDHDNARNTSEMTIGMGYTGNDDTRWDESDFHVFFDQDFLLSGKEADSRAIYFLLDQDSDLVNGPLLDRINVDGIRFSVDGGEVLVLESDDALMANNHAEFVAALQAGLAQLIADGKVPADTTLTVSTTLFDTTFLDDGSISSQIPAIVLETKTASIFRPIGYAQAQDAIGEYNVYGRLDLSSGIDDQPLSVQIALEKVGRGGDGGELIIGSMAKYSEGIDVFNVTVYGDASRPSSLSDLDSTGGKLSHVYITSDNDGFPGDTYADLKIGNSNTTDTVLNPGMTLVQSNGFMGNLSLGTSAFRVNDLGTLNTTDMSGSTTFWGEYDDNGLYRVNTGAGNDRIDVNLDGRAVNTYGNGLMIQSGAGNDSITVRPDPDYNISQLTMFELKNLSIDAGSGDDTVVVNGNFRFFIDAGSGSDYVYINSQQPALKGEWFVSNATGPATFADRVLYKAELTVTFAGFESTVTVQTDANGNFIADQRLINDAIIAAIKGNHELNLLLSTTKGTTDQQLIIRSNVDGANQLSIDLFQPELVASGAVAGAGQVNLATGDATPLLTGIVETDSTQNSATNPMTYVNGIRGSLDADGSVGSNFLAPSVGTSADATGGANVNFSVINMGSGANNLVVLDSNDLSANILLINQTFGKISVVNFFDNAALTQVGNHALDFTHYLNDVTSSSAGQSNLSEVPVAVTLNTTSTANANSVSMLTLNETATQTFRDLSASNLVTALNGSGVNFANLNNATLNAVTNTANLVGQTQSHVVMVENANNLGEYKVFYLTSTVDATTNTTGGNFNAGATYVGTMDFGNSINFNLVGSAGWLAKYSGWIAAADGYDYVPDPAYFEVVSVVYDGEMDLGDTFTVTVTIANYGDEQATQGVVFTMGESEITEVITLDGGDTGEVTFEFETDDLEAGEYTFQIATDNDSYVGMVTVADSDFDVRDFDQIIAVLDLETHDATDADFKFEFAEAGSNKLANINGFSQGDAVELQPGNDSIDFIGAVEGQDFIEIQFGELGNAWFVTFGDLDTDLVSGVAAAQDADEQIEILGNAWNIGDDAGDSWLLLA